MKRLYFITLLLLMACSSSKFIVDKSNDNPGWNFYHQQIKNCIKDNLISDSAILLLNDSIVIEPNKVRLIISHLPFETISSLSIIDKTNGLKIFDHVGSNGVIFIATKDFIKNFTPDTTRLENVKIGDDPICFLDNVTIDREIMNKINPNDIVALEILKNHSSSIYFKEKGADGTIFITSKKYAVELINARLTYILPEFKDLKADKIENFEKLLFVENDSIINNDKGYIGGLYNDDFINDSRIRILPSEEAIERFKDYHIENKTVIEIIKK